MDKFVIFVFVFTIERCLHETELVSTFSLVKTIKHISSKLTKWNFSSQYTLYSYFFFSKYKNNHMYFLLDKAK